MAQRVLPSETSFLFHSSLLTNNFVVSYNGQRMQGASNALASLIAVIRTSPRGSFARPEPGIPAFL